MSKALKEILQSTKESIKESLTLSNILGDIGKEFSNQVKHGAHEVGSALFNGSAFVMYPRPGKDSVDSPQHGLPNEPVKEQERGGMEM